MRTAPDYSFIGGWLLYDYSLVVFLPAAERFIMLIAGRSPSGERLCSKKLIVSNHQFQSTLPVWGTTFGYII
jgi:hypothetical protein